MTAPTLPTDTGQLGPGVLKIGATGSELEMSCYVNNANIAATDSTGDATTKLCGTTRPGVTTFTFQLSGNVDIDLGNESGFFALSWESKGTQQAFEFTPSTALGVKATGILVIKPLRMGADEYGADLTSDFTWDIVGDPDLTYPVTP
jgi:hypothetical protein